MCARFFFSTGAAAAVASKSVRRPLAASLSPIAKACGACFAVGAAPLRARTCPLAGEAATGSTFSIRAYFLYVSVGVWLARRCVALTTPAQPAAAKLFIRLLTGNERPANLQRPLHTPLDAFSLLHTSAGCTHLVPGGRNWAAEQLHKKLRVGGKSMVQIYHAVFTSLSDDASREVEKHRSASCEGSPSTRGSRRGAVRPRASMQPTKIRRQSACTPPSPPRWRIGRHPTPSSRTRHRARAGRFRARGGLGRCGIF